VRLAARTVVVSTCVGGGDGLSPVGDSLVFRCFRDGSRSRWRSGLRRLVEETGKDKSVMIWGKGWMGLTC
jgi:hypothetical protein